MKFENVKILILGAGGMVGRNIIEKAPKGFNILAPSRKELNLLNYDETFNYFSEKMPDIIVHSAGIVGGIQANISNPVKFLLENTDLGRNVIWAAYENGIKNVLNLGSSCMYPKDAKNPLTEEMILSGKLEPTNEGYAIAKIFTQKLCSYISDQNEGFMYKTIIPSNLYGRFDNFSLNSSHMIPAVIRKIHVAKITNNNIVEIWGDGSARREFLFASDFADFIWFAIRNFQVLPMLMNIGLGFDYSINEYYRTIAEVIGFDGEFKYNVAKPIGMKQKLVDITLQQQLGWEPKYSLNEGINITYNYFKQIYND